MSFADIFLVSMLRRGNLVPPTHPELARHSNVKRVYDFVLRIFECDTVRLEYQEAKFFENIHHYTSSAKFIEAIREGNINKAQIIAEESPWAVNGREPQDQ
jgi:hypothetical protein